MQKLLSKYTYRVTWSEDDKEFVALCAEFPSLSWLSPDPVDALSNLIKIIQKDSLAN